MDLEFVKLLIFLLAIAITHKVAISVAIDGEDAIKHSNDEIEEKSKDALLLDRIYVLENQMDGLREENKRILALLNEFRIDSNTEESIVKQPEEPENRLTTNENLQKATDIKKEPTNDDAAAFASDVLPQKPFRRVRSRRAAVVGGVAFSAYLTNTNEHMSPGQAIKFNHVLLNDGQGYNSYTGAFTAPVTGTYLFTFHFDTRKLTFVRLVLNGINQLDAVANPHTNVQSRPAQSMGGNAAIVHVLKGQAVLVETYEINDSEVGSSDTFRLSTFSGVLLY